MAVDDLPQHAQRSPTSRSAALGGRTRQATGRLRPPCAPGLDVLNAKIRPPPLRPGIVPRPLVGRLRRDTAAVVTIVARPGYGKTTLLAQWAAAETRPVAWLSIDARDNDPLVLVRNLVAAVDRVQPLDRRLLAALAAARETRAARLVPRAAAALASCSEPFVLALDDVDRLHALEARRALATLVARLPPGSTRALAGRTTPRFALGGLRPSGGLRELGVEELALTRREAQILLQNANGDLSEQQTANAVELCEGWPAALYLASLSGANATEESTTRGFGGSDRFVAEFIEAECLSQLRPRDVRFLRRASILGELTGPLCDAVLQTDDSQSRLDRLAGADLVVVPLAGRVGWYRFHPLFRQFFLRELLNDEPRVAATLHGRAADMYERVGDRDAALEHAEAAGDPDRVAELLTTTAPPALFPGRAQNVEQRLRRFSETWDLERYPKVALQGSWVHAFRGRAREAERWLEIAERGARRKSRDPAAVRAGLSVVRAALCRHGARRMVADAGAALAKVPRASEWYPRALHMRGSAALLVGAEAEADSVLAEAARVGALYGCTETQMIATSQRSLLAWRRQDRDAAVALSVEASELLLRADLKAYPTAAAALAASAQTALRQGRWADARQLVDAAEPLRASVTDAVPWLAVGIRLELGQCYLTLRDGEAARVLVDEIDAILHGQPRLGVLVEQARELSRDVDAMGEPLRGSRARLTPAELRLLPLLATHLSFREIAEQLEVSRNTVKTQAISIYRKLGVNGRSEAIRISDAGAAKAAV
jgi:LuxR family maltose regulon positive regulatory protein